MLHWYTICMGSDGAINDRDKYSALFLRVTRAAGLLIPFVAVAYGIAAGFSIVARSPAYNTTGLVIISVLFILLGIVQDIHKPNQPVSLGIYVGIYHLFAAIYLFVGPGFLSPIAFTLIVLAFITEIFYGRLGALITIAVTTLSALSIFLAESAKVLLAFEYAIYLMIIIVSMILLIMLRRVQLVEHEDLKRTQVQEKFQRQQLRALINSLGMAVLSTDNDGKIHMYNAALLDLLDTHDALAGKQLDEVFTLINHDGKPFSLHQTLSASDHLIERDDLLHQFSDGECMNLSISYAPIHGADGESGENSDGFIFIVRDITKAKSIEDERNEFISVVSHELRTPVAIVEATISMLQFEIENKGDVSHLMKELKDAHKQTLYLASIIKDLATLSRADRGVPEVMESIDCGELLNEMHAEYLERAKAKNLEFNLELPAGTQSVTSSRLYLKEILHNFITNAIKYTDSGTVTLAARDLGGQVEFMVKDTGIGISKSDQKRIFEKFYRSEDYLTRRHSGTGLGLYVVRKLSDKLGATVAVESGLEQGSTFRIALPKVIPVLNQETTAPADNPGQ